MKPLIKNPLVAAREAAGISRSELARGTGCGYSALAHAELGLTVHLSPTARRAIEWLGGDPESAAADYERWRASVGANVKRGPAPS